MPCLKHTLLSVLCLFVLNLFANAVPLSVRQADGSQTLNTVTTEMTPEGPVTTNCTIVLTPITDANGQMAVEEVQTCNLILDSSPPQPTSSATPVEPSLQNPPATKSNTDSTADSATSSVASITTASVTTSAVPSGGSDAVSTHPVSTVTVSSSSSVPTSSSSSDGAVSAQPVSTVTANTSTSVSSSASTGLLPGTTTSASASSTASAAAANASNVSSTTSAANGTTSGATAAADSSNAAIDLPGKTLAVLPIGLGVFAGISVIALIVVGLVTYERRKYRKAFRQRKLAESGAAMGYGGMAQ